MSRGSWFNLLSREIAVSAHDRAGAAGDKPRVGLRFLDFVRLKRTVGRFRKLEDGIGLAI
jgi:hypothetical protein